jgi:MoaA/NifB/PqqE/SkfB family radical SAM enzyme
LDLLWSLVLGAFLELGAWFLDLSLRAFSLTDPTGHGYAHKLVMDAPKKVKRRRFNWVVSDWVRKAMKVYLESSAKIKGQRFYCSALAGESDYNITVNCDLSVSCTCQDYDGSGHIGDLNNNSFKEVFFSPTAQRFRTELAKGKLPIMTCTRCSDLRKVSKSSVKSFGEAGNGNGSATAASPANGHSNGNNDALGLPLFAGPTPRLPYRGMLLENTVRCNIDCIGCDRESAARIRTTKQMDLDKLTKMADLVHDLGLQQLFYLNLGEPFLSPNIGKELPLLRQKNPDCRIVISTNGIILNNDAKREAAMSASHLFFSIAGIDDPMLKKYEHLGNYEKAYGAMKALVDYRNAKGLSLPLIEWKYLLFNWNDRRKTIERAIELAKAAGVDAISFWPTNNPFFGISYRYRLGFFNDIGVKCWKGREVDLRPPSNAPRPAL